MGSDGVDLWRANGLDALPVISHGFSHRAGGVSEGPFQACNLSTRVGDLRAHVMENRRRALVALGRPQAHLVVLKQVHGAAVVQVNQGVGPNIEADGAITSDKNAALAVLAADCVPLLFADGDGAFIAVAHAGWRGTQKNIAATMVTRLGKLGVATERLRAVLGPAIGPCCYEVQSDVAQQLQACYTQRADVAPAIARSETGHKVDLRAINRAQLMESGVLAGHIEMLPMCTHCRSDLFSHRRDAAQGLQTGRQAGLIAYTTI